MANEKDPGTLVPEFVEILFRSRQTLSQLYRLMDSHIGELYILMLLHQQDETHKVYAVDIQDRLSASKASISGMLASLEKKGFIRREIETENRRKIALSLTEDGKRELEAYKEPFNELIVAILEELGYDNSYALIGLLAQLSSALERVYAENKKEG